MPANAIPTVDLDTWRTDPRRALGLPAGTLTSLASNPTWMFNINRCPP